MEEYIHKLKASFSRALIDYLKVHTSHNVSGFLIEVLKASDVNSDPEIESVKLHNLVNGKQHSINFTGTVLLQIKLSYGSQNKYVEFWSRECPVTFDAETEEFIVGPIEDFLTIGFAR